MAKQSKGLCRYCGKEYTKGGMLRHLPSCEKRKARLEANKGKTEYGYFELVISDKYNTSYWLIVEIRETASLKDLDEFIRDIWVECCSHLSAFEIDGIQYESHPSMDSFWGPPAKSMNCKLKDVLGVGQVISYEYDFGSTTDLVVKVAGYRVGRGKGDKVKLLSRNNPLEILCSRCGKNKAQWINTEKIYDADPFLCEECIREEADTDAYIEAYLLPVCNSPRMGVCGYEGSRRFPDQFQPDGA